MCSRPGVISYSMRVGFGLKVGLAISLVSLGSTGFGVVYLYNAMRANIWQQMEHRVKDVARTGLFLLEAPERRSIETLSSQAQRLAAPIDHAHLQLPSGESKDTLPRSAIDSLQSRKDFQDLVQQLRKIKNGSRQRVVRAPFLKQGVLDPNDPPLIRFVYVLSAIPESPDHNLVMFVADGDYETLDENHNGVIDDDEQPTSIGMLYNTTRQDGLKRAFRGEVAANSSYTIDKWGTWVSAFVPIHNTSGNIIAVMGVDYSAHTELRLVRWLQVLCAGILFAGIVFSMLASVLISRRLGRPLQDLRTGALKARDGDYSVRIPVSTRDELGVLAEAFNAMMDRVQSYARELEEALARVQRVDRVKDEFLSNLSHELNTPLTIILGYAELLKENEPLPVEIRDGILTIQAQSEILGGYIADLMMLTQIETESRPSGTSLDIDQLIQKCLLRLDSHIVARGIRVGLSFCPDPIVRGDGPLLLKALEHVLTNAVLYNRQGGEIAIEVEKVGNRVQITVADTGIGIWPGDLERIWEKFYRVDSSLTYTARGVGIGLFLARRIAELHGGTIAVKSVPEKGSRFIIVL